jgi:hypothetical protein
MTVADAMFELACEQARVNRERYAAQVKRTDPAAYQLQLRQAAARRARAMRSQAEPPQQRHMSKHTYTT